MRAKRIASAPDDQLSAFHEHLRELSPRRFVNRLRGRPRNAHLPCSLFLCQREQIDEPDRFVFVQRHFHRIARSAVRGLKGFTARQRADSPAFLRPCQFDHLGYFWHMPILSFFSQSVNKKEERKHAFAQTVDKVSPRM